MLCAPVYWMSFCIAFTIGIGCQSWVWCCFKTRWFIGMQCSWPLCYVWSGQDFENKVQVQPQKLCLQDFRPYKFYFRRKQKRSIVFVLYCVILQINGRESKNVHQWWVKDCLKGGDILSDENLLLLLFVVVWAVNQKFIFE